MDTDSNVTVTAPMWLDVVLPDQPKLWDDHTRQRVKNIHWMIVVIFPPKFPQPMLLIVTISLGLSAKQVHAFYIDRWGIEHPPLVAKPLLGAFRQFVFADPARQRLPELTLLAGSVLRVAYVAASHPPIPTGFWDRAPKSGSAAWTPAPTINETSFPSGFLAA
jgi:hypothetical protein